MDSPSDMSRDELIRLVERIMAGEGDQEQHGELIDLLEDNVMHPRVTDLIYHSDVELSAEEIVDEALRYKPFEL